MVRPITDIQRQRQHQPANKPNLSLHILTNQTTRQNKRSPPRIRRLGRRSRPPFPPRARACPVMFGRMSGVGAHMWFGNTF